MLNGKKANKESPSIFKIPELLLKRKSDILDAWMKNQLVNVTLRPELINKKDLKTESKEFLTAFIKAISTGNMEDIKATEYKPIIKMLQEISRSRAVQGFSPSETATYIFSFQDTIIPFLQEEYVDKPEVVNQEVVILSKLIVKLGLVTFESFTNTREDIINKQSALMLEMSIPVMTLWKNILMVPIIGAVDSKRAQLMMELILKKIMEIGSKTVIIDILGVASMDTAVASHLLKITRAAALMRSKRIISGISPSVAQTMVHLGIELSGVVTTSTLSDALELSYKMLGLEVIKRKRQ